MDDDIEMVHKEGEGEKDEEGSKIDDNDGDDNAGRERRERGSHPWRMPPTTMIYTAPSPPEVLLLLTPKAPRANMKKRGAWLEYFSSGYAQWDTWRP